jgi:hypothetical protein
MDYKTPVLRFSEEDAVRCWSKVHQTAECWVWTAARSQTGYGNFAVRVGPGQQRWLQAHQVAFELRRGPIPDGLEIDHLCRNRACVNPDHLEPVTRRENVRRGAAGKRFSERTHCGSGHEYTALNTIVVIRKNGQPLRRCKACEKIWRDKARRER